MKLWLALVSLILVSCSQDTPDKTVEHTRLGRIDFIVQSASLRIWQPVVIADGTQFWLQTFDYRISDKIILIIGSPLPAATVAVPYPQPTLRCTFAQSLTSAQVNMMKEKFATLELCRQKFPPGTLMPLYVPSLGLELNGYGRSAAFPMYEGESMTGICNDSPITEIRQAMLDQADFTQPMSCTLLPNPGLPPPTF
jgi:hypothetical protein